MELNNNGWTCPRCNRVWAPSERECGPCNAGLAQPVITTTPTVAPQPWYPYPSGPYDSGAYRPYWPQPWISFTTCGITQSCGVSQ